LETFAEHLSILYNYDADDTNTAAALSKSTQLNYSSGKGGVRIVIVIAAVSKPCA